MRSALLGGFMLIAASAAPAAEYPARIEGDAVLRDFRFDSGEVLAELRLHYTTIGTLARDAAGMARNAVLLLHSTGGRGRAFLRDEFAGALFGPGQVLDASRYFIILPDGIGHGGSSKPSDGLHARFPHYVYDDMVRAQYLLLTQALNVDHLRLILGTSMGGMHTWLWGEKYPEFADALVPLASLPVQIAGRNRMFRHLIIDAIRNDPAWQGGEYTTQPHSLATALQLTEIIAGGAVHFYKQAASSAAADELLDKLVNGRIGQADANDVLYQFEASRGYDPAPELGRISPPLLAINSADDEINPAALGVLEKEIKRVKRGRMFMIPASDRTRGHRTYFIADLWKQELAALLKESERD
jgi:homoserine O-acetyltransferase/O-succinyltransferase